MKRVYVSGFREMARDAAFIKGVGRGLTGLSVVRKA